MRMARIEVEKTLRQTEEETGVTKDTISRIERGLREPHPLTIAKLAKAYGRPTEELLVPKESAPPSLEPSFNDVLNDERRSTAFIKALRAYFWDLRLRWKEQGDKPSPGQIRDALDLLQRLTNHGAFEGSFTPREHSELQLLLNAADKLRPIAEELAAKGGTTPSRQMVDEVFEELDKQLEKAIR
jgi:transcriptional regulator with XRE-family HTH domain